MGPDDSLAICPFRRLLVFLCRIIRPALLPMLGMAAISPALFAQAIFVASSSPANVIESGRAELGGALALVQVGGTTIYSSLIVSYGESSIANPGTQAAGFMDQGIRLSSNLRNAAGAPVSCLISSVVPSPGTVSISIGAGAVTGSIRLEGVRFDIAGKAVKTVQATLVVQPGDAIALGGVGPVLPVIAGARPGLVLDPTGDTSILIPPVAVNVSANIIVKEGFANAFTSTVGIFGQNTPIQILIRVLGIPRGISLTFPAQVTCLATGATLRTRYGQPVVLKGGEVEDSVAYLFASDPILSDSTSELFEIRVRATVPEGDRGWGEALFRISLAPISTTENPTTYIPRFAPVFLPQDVDEDFDGLTNSEEAKIGTDPLKPDTDGDGLTDGEEVFGTFGFVTNPLKKDTDDGGLSDAEEIKLGLNPTVAESALSFNMMAGQPDTTLDILNPFSTSATLSLSARDSDGMLVSVPGIPNPKTLSLYGGTKASLSVSDVFGSSAIDKIAAIDAAGNNDLLFGSSLIVGAASHSSGTLVAPILPQKELVFPSLGVGEGSNTSLSVHNPGAREASATLALMSAEGQVIGSSRIKLSGSGSLTALVRDIFPSSPAAGGYVRLTSDQGLTGAQAYEKPPMLATLKGLAIRQGTGPIYVPYFCSGGPYITRLSLLNLGNGILVAQVTAYRHDGIPLAAPTNPATFLVGPGEQRSISVKELFGLDDRQLQTGYLVMRPTSTLGFLPVNPQLVGVIHFESTKGDFLTVASLVPETGKEFYFLRSESTNNWYSGFAALNLSKADAASVRWEAYTKDGYLMGHGEHLLGPGKMSAMLLTEIVPSMIAMVDGYVKVTSSQAISAVEMVGTNDLSQMYTVLPQGFR